jgi:hypothetical protein
MRIVTLTVIGTLVLGTLGALGVVHARQGRRASPHESVSEAIDGSDITITYGRPFMRGRMIFGGLVAWDCVWVSSRCRLDLTPSGSCRHVTHGR